MRYAVKFVWNDGQEDGFIAESAQERDMSIKDMLERGEFKEINYCKIYKSGEYGKRVWVLK